MMDYCISIFAAQFFVIRPDQASSSASFSYVNGGNRRIRASMPAFPVLLQSHAFFLQLRQDPSDAISRLSQALRARRSVSASPLYRHGASGKHLPSIPFDPGYTSGWFSSQYPNTDPYSSFLHRSAFFHPILSHRLLPEHLIRRMSASACSVVAWIFRRISPGSIASFGAAFPSYTPSSFPALRFVAAAFFLQLFFSGVRNFL